MMIPAWTLTQSKYVMRKIFGYRAIADMNLKNKYQQNNKIMFKQIQIDLHCLLFFYTI